MKEQIKLEKYTKSRYEKYVKKGIPFKLVNEGGREYRIVSQNCGTDGKQMVVEEHYTYDGRERVNTYYADENGKMYKDHLYIWTGCTDIEKGDLIISSRSESEDAFYFFGYFDGVCSCEKSLGFGLHWEMDCYGGQLNLCSIFHNLSMNPDVYLRKATEEEEDKYWEYMLANGYDLDDDTGRLFEVPKVGTEYWSIEMENGKAVVVHHDPAKTEEERMRDHKHCYTSKNRAESRAKQLNETRLY